MAFCYSGRWLRQHCLNHIRDDLCPSLCLPPLNCLLIPWSHQASLALFLSTWSPLASTLSSWLPYPSPVISATTDGTASILFPFCPSPLEITKMRTAHEPLVSWCHQKLASGGNPFAASRGSSSRAGPPRRSSTPLNATGELNCWVPRQTLSCCIVWT